MKIGKLLLWGAVGYVGYKWLKGRGAPSAGGTPIDVDRTYQACVGADKEALLAQIAGIYGIQQHQVGCRVPDAAGRVGGVEVYDLRNGKGMIWSADGSLQTAYVNASTAAAEAGGGKIWATQPYGGSVYVIG